MKDGRRVGQRMRARRGLVRKDVLVDDGFAGECDQMREVRSRTSIVGWSVGIWLQGLRSVDGCARINRL